MLIELYWYTLMTDTCLECSGIVPYTQTPSLPFGLRSVPKVFSDLAEILEWILLHN